jgi:hypothetical protein
MPEVAELLGQLSADMRDLRRGKMDLDCREDIVGHCLGFAHVHVQMPAQAVEERLESERLGLLGMQAAVVEELLQRGRDPLKKMGGFPTREPFRQHAHDSSNRVRGRHFLRQVPLSVHQAQDVRRILIRFDSGLYGPRS